MTQPSRWGLARFARATAAAAVLLLGAGRLFAQGTTGKVEGTIRDQAGAPIAGAQVLIVGSALNSTTNEQGYYFINGVPAGVMTVRAQFIGYAPAERREVRVFAGQTMTVNLTLEQRAIEVGGITVTVEANPLVPRDQVASKPIVQGDLIDELPADNINQVLRLQPGVVEGARGLVIRGGRPNEQMLYVDGVPVRNSNQAFVSAGATPQVVTVGTNAVEEASVTTGAIGAEFGDAQSGVISLVTRAGGSQFRGNLSFATDEISGETYGQGLNRVEASFGGPLSRNLTFFLSATAQGQNNGLRGKGAEESPTWVLNGLDTSNPEAPNGYVMAPLDALDPLSDSIRVDIPAFAQYSEGSRIPYASASANTFSGKLQYSYGTGSRLAMTYHMSRNQQFNGRALYNPQSQRGQRQNNSALIINWAQNLSRSAENALTLEANLSYQNDQFMSGLLDPAWNDSHRETFGGFTLSSMQFFTNFDNFPVDDQLIRNIRLNACDPGAGGRCVPYLGRTDLGTRAPYRTNPYGVSAGTSFYSTSGYGTGGPVLSKESRWTGRAQLDWQANRYNRVKVGGDFTRSDMAAFTSALHQQIFMNAYKETPMRYAMFAMDRVDLGDVVIELGLRYDRLNSGVMYPRTPSRVFSDPLRAGDSSRAYTAEDSAVAGRCLAATPVYDPGGNLLSGDSTALSTCNFVEAPAHSSLAPSIRVSFPITDRTGFRLSYAHQTQTPDFSFLVGGVNSDLNFTNSNDIFGRDLSFGRSILFEFGIRHAFSDDMVLDVSAYNKDKVSDIAARVLPIWDANTGTTQNLNMLGNFDFGNARGIEFLLDRRFGQLFQARVSYTFQSAQSTGSDPYEYLNTLSRQVSSLTGDRTPPPQALLTTRDNRTHTLAGTATLSFPSGWKSGTTAGMILQDFGFFATFRFASGLGYTRLENIGRGQQGPGTNFGLGGTAVEPLNTSTMPWIKNFDLRVTRAFRLGGGRDFTAFMDFRNLFNFTNLSNVWAETGDIYNALHRSGTVDPVIQTLRNEAAAVATTVTVGGRTLEAYDLRDCSLYPYNSNGTAGVPNCLFLRGAEGRYGNGDGILDADERDTAYNAWYDSNNGPHTLRAPGRNVRIGFEFNF